MARSADYFSDFTFTPAEAPPVAVAPKPQDESWLKDTGASVMSGVFNVMGTAGYVVGADDFVTKAKQAEDRANSLKSSDLRDKEVELSRLIQAGDYTGAASYVALHPSLLSSTVASSLPASVLGGGMGGLIGKAMLATKSAAVVNAAGNLTRLASGAAAGIGEGSLIAADVYKNTDGNMAAAGAGGLLGFITNIATPGNFGTAVTRTIANPTDEAASLFAGVGAKQAAGRLAVAGVAEGAQELGQETGQALIEQGGRGEDLNFNVALAQGAVGALAGHAMGTVGHPFVGDGSAHAAKQTELGDAERVLAEIEKAGGDTSVMQATVNKLALEANILSTNTPITIEQRGELEVLDAKLVAARNPTSTEAQENADTLEAVNLAGKGTEVAKAATEMATGAAVEAIQTSETLDEALTNFGAHAQASSVGRVGVTSATNTAAGIAEAAIEASANLYSAEAQAAADADVTADPGSSQASDPVLAVRSRYDSIIDNLFAVAANTANPEGVRDAATARIRTVEAERDRIAPLPSEQVPYTQVDSDAIPVAETPAVGGPYNVVRSPEGWDVIAADDSVYDSYPIGAPNDAVRAAAYLNNQEGTQVAAAERMVGEDRAAAFTPLIQAQRRISGDVGLPFAEREAASAEARRLVSLRDAEPNRPVTAVARAREEDQLLADLAAPSDMPTLRPRLKYVQDDQNNWNILDENSTDYVFNQGYATRAELADVIRNDTMLVQRAVAPTGFTVSENAQGNFEVTDNSRRRVVSTHETRAAAEMAARLNATPATPVTATPRRADRPASLNTREVTSNFVDRGLNALNDKVLEKLGAFWQTVMAGKGQRVLTVNTRNLKGRGLAQAQLNKLKDKYNAELRKQAAIWAEENNKPLPATMFDPVVEISTNGRNVNVRVRGLGRNGQNPYLAVNPERIAAASMYDNHLNTVGLERAGGSADIGYRLFAEMASMKGSGIDASSVLLTNNNIRRHVQSIYADTLFGVGSISPMQGNNRQSDQGVPQGLWEASSPTERVGLNMLRLAHSVSENRYNTGTLAAFTENLKYQRDGSIVAASEPVDPRGFEKGAVVTDKMLLDKLLERFPTRSSDEEFMNEAGVRMTNAMGRTNQGGVGVDTAKLAIMTNTVLGTIEGQADKKVPGWLVTLAKQTGRDMGGWMFSRGEETASGQDADTLRERLRKLMVNPAKFDERVTVVQSRDDIPGSFTRTPESTEASTVMAFYDPATDHIWMVADHIPQGREFAVFLHEAGVHMGMRKLLGGNYSALVTQIREWSLGSGKLENQIAQLALQRVTDAEKASANGLSKRVADEELVAYFVEEAVSLGVNPTALSSQPKTMQAWFAKLWDAVKVAMAKFGVDPSTLTAEDVIDLAYGAARLQLNDSVTDQDAAAEATAQEFDAPTTEGMTVGEAVTTKGETVQGVHYSDKRRTELDTTKYGNGMPGAEARRLDNGGIKERTMFYVDEGTGIIPESGVGRVAHDVTLENMYNTKTDVDGFVAAHRGDSNAWEQAILDAGYNGYYAPGKDGKQGAAVVLGKKIIPVPQVDAPKPDILNSIAAVTAPVTPANPNELNIVNPKSRSGSALLEEKIRAMFQDKHVTLRRIQQLAGVMAEQIKLDTMGALDRLGSKMMAKHRELVKVPQQQIEDIMTKGGFTPEEGRAAIDSYLKNLHVAEYNDHIATINPATYDATGTRIKGFDATHTGSGITSAAAAAEIARLEALSPRKVAALKDANKVYRKMIDDLQKYAVKRGLEKQDTVDTWNAMFPNYTPFNRDLDIDVNLSIGSVAGTRDLSMRAGISRTAMGSGADIVSPLAASLLLGDKIVRRGENAIVARTVLEFAKNFVPRYKTASGEWKDMWTVGAVPDVRVTKLVNVYEVRLANGSMSMEFYNRDDANAHADMLQTAWVAANPNANPNSSGIIAQKKYQTPQKRVVMQQQPNILNQPNVFVVPVDGENQIVTFDMSSEDAANILKALKGEDVSKLSNASWLTIPRMFSQWTVAMATGFNPVFIAFNIARDVPGAAINMGSHGIPGWKGSDSLALLHQIPFAVRGLYKRIRAEWASEHSNAGALPPAARGTDGWWYDQAVRSGGVTGVRESFADLDSAETQLRRMYGQNARAIPLKANEVETWVTKLNGGLAKVGDSFYRFGEGTADANKIVEIASKSFASRIAHLNNAGEAATRTIVFKHATEKFMAAGHSEAEAMKLAANVSKNISTNFNRRGASTTFFNQLFPFFNAATQGSARLAETVFEKHTIKTLDNGVVVLDQKTRFTSYGAKVAGSMVALGALQAVILMAADFEDDEPPKEIKDRAFILPTGDGGYVAIPMPHGFNVLANFGREMADAAIYPETRGDHIANALWQSANFSPTGASGNVLFNMMPAIADPVVGVVTGKDAFGRPIGREDLNPADPTPGFTRAKEGASATGRRIAEGLNSLTGGNEDQPGSVSPTPDMVDFIIGSIGGGLGREVSKAARLGANTLSSAAGNEVEEIPTYKIPLVGRLVGDVESPVSQRSRMFKIRTELNTLNNRYEGLLDREEYDKAETFRAAHPELDMRTEFERFARGDAKQRKARAQARGDDEIGEVNRITTEQDEGVTELLARYKELVDAEE